MSNVEVIASAFGGVGLRDSKYWPWISGGSNVFRERKGKILASLRFQISDFEASCLGVCKLGLRSCNLYMVVSG